MSFLKKWTSSAQLAPEVSEKRLPAHAPPFGPERGLPILPNELIPTVLTRLDSRSLFRVAQVSRRFNELSTRDLLARHGITPAQLASRHVVINSDLPGEAFAAIRTALFLRVRPLTGLTCIMPFVVDSKVIYQLDSLISWFTPRLATTELDFGVDMIPHSTSVRPTARALTKLVCTFSADCPTTVFVLMDGLFTCRPDTLRRWNPATGQYEGWWAESTYSKLHMHDGSRQRVPTIRSLQTLSIKYPLHTSSPFDKWKLVVVDAASLTDLQLSIKLARHEWSAILGGLTLPALVCVGLWAEAISMETSTLFFNRHPKIRIIKYMSATADALPAGCEPLHLPHLESLNTLAPYLVRILGTSEHAAAACADDALSTRQRFPSLSHIELRPHVRLHDALLLVSAHTPLSALTLWSLSEAHLAGAPWPTFPSVRRLTLNESRVVQRARAAGLPALLARAFPALAKVEVNYSWANNADISNRQVKKERRAFVEEVKATNPGVRKFLFDGKEHAVLGS